MPNPESPEQKHQRIRNVTEQMYEEAIHKANNTSDYSEKMSHLGKALQIADSLHKGAINDSLTEAVIKKYKDQFDSINNQVNELQHQRATTPQQKIEQQIAEDNLKKLQKQYEDACNDAEQLRLNRDLPAVDRETAKIAKWQQAVDLAERAQKIAERNGLNGSAEFWKLKAEMAKIDVGLCKINLTEAKKKQGTSIAIQNPENSSAEPNSESKSPLDVIRDKFNSFAKWNTPINPPSKAGYSAHQEGNILYLNFPNMEKANEFISNMQKQGLIQVQGQQLFTQPQQPVINDSPHPHNMRPH